MSFIAQKAATTYLYTKGKEFCLGLEEYIGEYHLNGTIPYTGPKSTPTAKRLERYHPSKQFLTYINLAPKQKSFLTYVQPTKGFVYPTEDNYNLGTMYRYFVKNRLNQEQIIEIDDVQAKHYSKDYGIDPVIYQFISVPWTITRDITKLKSVEIENTKATIRANFEMPGLSDNIYSYTEFSEIII